MLVVADNDDPLGGDACLCVCDWFSEVNWIPFRDLMGGEVRSEEPGSLR